MITPKFRASYTVLSQWASGNWEQAIKSYFKLEDFITPAMVEGREWHEKWKAHTSQTGCLPIEFGNRQMKNPIVEIKKVVSMSEWLDLVFIIDCLEAPIIHEYKTGKQSSEVHANSKQLGVYAVGATLTGHYVNQGIVHHYDQYKKSYDMSMVWITDKMLDETNNWIETISSEMHDYFVKNDLYLTYSRENAVGLLKSEVDAQTLFNINNLDL